MSIPSVFEILGPVMVGPSSSHTGGAARIGLAARRYLGESPVSIDITLYGTYAKTCRGHKTDVALVGGCLGFSPDDGRIRGALEEARSKGIEVTVRLEDRPDFHPNTAILVLEGASGRKVRVKGVSIGGGSIRIESAEEVAPPRGTPVVAAERFQTQLVEATAHTGAPAVGAPEGATGKKRDADAGVWVEGLETCEELVAEAERRGVKLSDLILQQESAAWGEPPNEILKRLGRILATMRAAVEDGLKGEIRSIGGLTGDDAAKAWRGFLDGRTIGGPLLSKAVAWALAVSETNSAMGVVAAAPTGGACGALPGALLACADELKTTEEEALSALLVAGGIGARVAAQTSLSASVAGCQVEAGVAAGMAAAAVTHLAGGAPRQCADAAAIAIKAFLGLGCDAIAGLVEVPCIKRNAIAAVASLAAANMALVGIRSQVPLDEVIWALADVGRHIPQALRDTMQAGLACTPTGRAVYKRLYGEELGS